MQLPQLKTSLNNLIRHSTKSVSVADVSLPHLTVTLFLQSDVNSKSAALSKFSGAAQMIIMTDRHVSKKPTLVKAIYQYIC